MSNELIELLVKRDERIAYLESDNKRLREALEKTQEHLLMSVYANLPESPTRTHVISIMKDIVDTLNK